MSRHITPREHVGSLLRVTLYVQYIDQKMKARTKITMLKGNREKNCLGTVGEDATKKVIGCF